MPAFLLIVIAIVAIIFVDRYARGGEKEKSHNRKSSYKSIVMDDSLNIGHDKQPQTQKPQGDMTPVSLSEKFKKWITIDFWASIVVTAVICLSLSDTLPEEAGIPCAIAGIALCVIFANVKKYFFLVVLEIYEKYVNGK